MQYDEIMSMPASRYTEMTVRAIFCTTCDEEVSPDGASRSEADQAVYDHERARHAIPLRNDAPREGCPGCAGTGPHASWCYLS